MRNPSWTVESLASPNVHRITFRGEGLRESGRVIRVLLTSDRHIDSKHSNRAMQKRHLEQALDENAPVIDLGDLFDAMQSRHDNRRSRDEIDPRLATRDDYVTGIIEEWAPFFDPYSSQLAVMGIGNHETAIRKHTGVDLHSMLMYRLLHANPACPVQVGGYTGWVVFRFIDETKGGTKNPSMIKRLKYRHGEGGGAIMTKGTLANVRRAAIFPQADIVVGGHIHEDWSMVLSREELTANGRVRHAEQLHLSIPSYKEEYGEGLGGWHVERGAPPKPIGATWLTFQLYVDEAKNWSMHCDAQRAR